MMRLAFYLSLFVVSVSSFFNYDLEQIQILLHRTIGCLEKYEVLNENATHMTSLAYAFSDISAYIPNISSEKEEDIKLIQDRLKRIMIANNHVSSNNPHGEANNALYKTLYWFNLTDMSIKFGQIKKLSPLNKNLAEIIADTAETPEIAKCNRDIIVSNPASNGRRTCELNCLEEMTNLNYKTYFKPEAKWCYIGIAMMTNCSNLSPQEYRRLATHFCSYTKIEVDKMILSYKNKPHFYAGLYYCLKKIGFCASWGVAEILSPEIITTILSKIDCNGCVAIEKGEEISTILTAGTTFVLVVLYRFVLEMTTEIF